MAVIGICPFLTVSWVGLQRVVVAFPGHSHLLSDRVTTRYLSHRIARLALPSFHSADLLYYYFSSNGYPTKTALLHKAV